MSVDELNTSLGTLDTYNKEQKAKMEKRMAEAKR